MADGYRVLLADPPWRVNPGSLTNGTKWGKEQTYPTMPLEDILSFKLPSLADDCILFLWRLACFVPQAYSVVQAWGFKPVTEVVWRKTTKTGKICFGPGMTVHSSHETCIVARRGKNLRKARNVRSVFDADEPFVFDAERGRHSQKPGIFYDIVESLYDGPYAELFARDRRSGWDAWGNQLDEPGAELHG